MAATGILGAGAGTWLGAGIEFVAFCVVVGVGALAVLVRGESSVAPVMFSVGLFAVGLFAVVLAVGYGVRDTLTGASFAVCLRQSLSDGAHSTIVQSKPPL